jgi:predicted HicB family RNase H-like nuclease
MAKQVTPIIHPDELPVVRAYLARKREAIGSTAFLELRQVQSVSDFDAWRVKWLAAAEWNQLRAALRQHRRRKKTRGEQVRLAVPRTTHEALKLRAQQSGSSINSVLSQFIGGTP